MISGYGAYAQGRSKKINISLQIHSPLNNIVKLKASAMVVLELQLEIIALIAY